MDRLFDGRQGSKGGGVSVTVLKVFCPTGEGGGIDPTCSPGKTSGGSGNVPSIPSGITDARITVKIHSTLTDLSNEYGVKVRAIELEDLKDGPDKIVSAQMLTTSGGRYVEGKQVWEHEHVLLLDKAIWKDAESWTAQRKAISAGTLADSSIVGSLRHEYAHALDAAHPELHEKSKELFREYRKFPALGSYSGSDRREMVAEAFAHYKLAGSLEGTGLEGLKDVFDAWKRPAQIKKKIQRLAA
jgi:hypothetical protein